jgi:hypothetical protein
MPNFDGTGPRGNGTGGRGLGPCGQGRTARRGSGNRANNKNRAFDAGASIYPYTKADLNAQKQELEAQLRELDKELNKG